MTNKIEFTKEWLDSIPKIINGNGCWIPSDIAPNDKGYTRIWDGNRFLSLHRIVICVHYEIDYDDPKIDTRHNTGCDHRCFFIKHLQPGSHSDNIRDSVNDKTHRNSRKECCPKCGGPYTIKVNKTGQDRGRIYRRCLTCRDVKNKER